MRKNEDIQAALKKFLEKFPELKEECKRKDPEGVLEHVLENIEDSSIDVLQGIVDVYGEKARSEVVKKFSEFEYPGNIYESKINLALFKDFSRNILFSNQKLPENFAEFMNNVEMMLEYGKDEAPMEVHKDKLLETIKYEKKLSATEQRNLIRAISHSLGSDRREDIDLALVLACKKNDLEIIDFLLKRGADPLKEVSWEDDMDREVTSSAIESLLDNLTKKKTKMLQDIMRSMTQKQSVEFRNKINKKFWDSLLSKMDAEVQLLKSLGAQMPNQPIIMESLISALNEGYVNQAELAFKHLKKVEQKFLDTALDKYLNGKNIEMIELLFDKGAKVKQTVLDESLIKAQKEDDIDRIALLLTKGANIRKQSLEKLQLHSRKGSFEKHSIIELLIERGELEAVRKLLESGWSPNFSERERSLLRISKNNKEIHELLIEYGADPKGEKLYDYLVPKTHILGFSGIMPISLSGRKKGKVLLEKFKFDSEGSRTQDAVSALDRCLSEFLESKKVPLKGKVEKNPSVLVLREFSEAVRFTSTLNCFNSNESHYYSEKKINKPKGLSEVKKRYQESIKDGRLCFIPSGWPGHAVSITLFRAQTGPYKDKNILIYTNRGDEALEPVGSRTYVLNDKISGENKIAPFIDKVFDETSSFDEFKDEFNRIVDNADLIDFTPQKSQRHGTCGFVNKKSSLQPVLRFFNMKEKVKPLIENDLKKNQKEIKEACIASAEYALYKEFTSFIRNRSIDSCLEELNGGSPSPLGLSVLLKYIDQHKQAAFENKRKEAIYDRVVKECLVFCERFPYEDELEMLSVKLKKIPEEKLIYLARKEKAIKMLRQRKLMGFIKKDDFESFTKEFNLIKSLKGYAEIRDKAITKCGELERSKMIEVLKKDKDVFSPMIFSKMNADKKEESPGIPSPLTPESGKGKKPGKKL